MNHGTHLTGRIAALLGLVTLMLLGGCKDKPSVHLIATSTTTPCAGDVSNIYLAANTLNWDSAISKVEFYSGGTLIATKLTAPWTTTYADASGGKATYTAKAFDNGTPALSASSEETAVTIYEAVISDAAISGQIIVEPGIEGLITSDKQLSFQGQLNGFPANSAVFINAIMVPLSLDGKFFINNLSLKDGVNTITIKANTLNGSMSKSFTVVSTVNASYPDKRVPDFDISVLLTRKTDAPLTIPLYIKEMGDAPNGGNLFDYTQDTPLSKELIIRQMSSATFDSITVENTRDGIVDRVVLATELKDNMISLPLGTTRPDLHTLKVTIWQDAAKTIKLHETKRYFDVSDPYEYLNHKKQVFQWIIEQFKSDTPSKAYAAFPPGPNRNYCVFFERLSDPTITAKEWGAVVSVRARGKNSDLSIVSTRNGKPIRSLLYIRQGHDGLWRIANTYA